MSVLLTGCSGQLGRCIQEELGMLEIPFHALTKKQLSIDDPNQVNDIFNKLQPSIIINAAAYTNVDQAENEAKKAFKVNGEGPKILSLACNRMKIPLVHISTDFVFDGISKKSYLPSDIPNPISIYGQSKLQGETYIINTCNQFYIIRTSWVFSNYGSNFFKTVLELSRTKDEFSIVNDQIGCPTFAKDLAKAIVVNLDIFQSGQYANTVYHYSGDEFCSWFNFAEYISKKAYQHGYILNLPNIKPIKSEEYKSAIAIRPKFSALDSSNFCELFNVSKSDWRSAVDSTIRKLCF